MRKQLTIMAMAAIVFAQAMTTAPAFAEGSNAGGGYSDRQPVSPAATEPEAPAGMSQPAATSHDEGGRVYQGRGGYYRHECGGNGVVGTVAGGVGGGVLGDLLIGGGPIGILIGGIGGALLGRHFDKKHTAAENHC